MPSYTQADLEAYAQKVEQKAAEFGLDHYEVVYESCDHRTMINRMAYSGIPFRYHHWSFGKAYDVINTQYSYGVTGLPYEMVINANPAIAYLMLDNPLAVQVLVMAHVLGHVNFFKHNYVFVKTYPQDALASFKTHARRINEFIDTYGVARVERVLDAAKALEFNTIRTFLVQEASRETEEPSEWSPKKKVKEPTEDILSFIRDHNPMLEPWQKDVLTIVHDEALYFLPQIETKIMNEGWATFWHYRIMNALDLPFDMQMEFLKLHNRIVQPAGGSINPYAVGFAIWQDLNDRLGTEALFSIMEGNRDVSFLRQFLSREIMERLHMFAYKKKGPSEVVVKELSDDQGWKSVREELIRWVGVNSLPVIKVSDVEPDGTLTLVYQSDGRKLDPDYREHTLRHIEFLWGNRVKMIEVSPMKMKS